SAARASAASPDAIGTPARRVRREAGEHDSEDRLGAQRAWAAQQAAPRADPWLELAHAIADMLQGLRRAGEVVAPVAAEEATRPVVESEPAPTEPPPLPA